MQSGWTMNVEKQSRERKMALQQDVDKLKKRLRYEENVHRALERAFTRPLGTRPRLPPYLPAQTLELLAEIAILEEEVVRLEEKVVHFRRGLYQEAVHVSCCYKNTSSSSDDLSEFKFISNNSISLLDERRREENQPTNPQSDNYKLKPVKKHLIECASCEWRMDTQKPQLENRVMGSRPNKISESILKCLVNMFLRMSFKNNFNSSDSSAYKEYSDPYDICSKFGKVDIGPYKHYFAFETKYIDQNRTTISAFLVRRLKLLFHRLAKINLQGLSHQEKLAFWINIYNSCLMNSFIENGIPESPERVVDLMQKATLNVGGFILNAITIEHFILRLPYHSKYTFSKCTKYDEMMKSSVLGLEFSEPLVTFALSCGSWSSPAVRVYTASHVENELEIAKRDYLQAAVGISSIKRVIAIPKLLDWYLLDFAKDLDSLLDWICLQLPAELGKKMVKCRDESFLRSLEIVPYEFSFRYLFHT